MPISNAEKQARFRKKEQLNKFVSRVYRDCQLTAMKPHIQRTIGDLEAQLREAARLPSGWTDEDLERAVVRVQNIWGEVMGTGDPLGVDVNDGRNPDHDGLARTPNPGKWMEEMKQAERNTIALAGHLVSALELSQLRYEDCAAALMEAVRFVGRGLGNSSSEGRSAAMAVCLASLNPHYARPDWFIDRFADWLATRLDPETRRALGARLIQEGAGFPQ